FGTAPISNLHGSFVDFLVLAVARRDVDERSRSQKLHAGWCVRAKNGLEVDFLAESIYAAIAEHRSPKNRFRLAKVETVPEVVRPDAFMPVASEVRRVAVLFGDDNEFEFPEFRARTAGRHHRAIGAGCRLPSNGVGAIDERHARPRHR